MTTSTFSVGEGDRLVFYTDGLLEARDRAGRYFRLEDCADTLRGPDLEAAADELLDRLVAHTGRRLDDDVAVLLFEAASSPALGGRDLTLREQPVGSGPTMILWLPAGTLNRAAASRETTRRQRLIPALPRPPRSSIAWRGRWPTRLGGQPLGVR